MHAIANAYSRHFSQIVTLFFITCFSYILTACTTIPQPQLSGPTTAKPVNEKNWQEHENRLAQVQNWQVTGKIAVRTNKDSGTASVDWRENHGNYSVALTGPMGANGLTLRGSPSHVTLYTGDGKRYSSGSAEQMLAEKWGFNLPISNIKYWIKGLPVPGIPYKSQFDMNNRLASLSQGGFFIQYSDYTRSGNYDLPHRIAISSAQLKTRIIIYSWKIF